MEGKGQTDGGRVRLRDGGSREDGERMGSGGREG